MDKSIDFTPIKSIHSSNPSKPLKKSGKVSRLRKSSKPINFNPPLKDCLGYYNKDLGRMVWKWEDV